jgi:hypothetical protein
MHVLQIFLHVVGIVLIDAFLIYPDTLELFRFCILYDAMKDDLWAPKEPRRFLQVGAIPYTVFWEFYSVNML